MKLQADRVAEHLILCQDLQINDLIHNNPSEYQDEKTGA